MNEMFPSRWLKADDLEQDTVVQIRTVESEMMKDDDGKEEEKHVIYFLKSDKGMVLNKTNAQRIVDQHGDESDDWPGKRVTLTKEYVTAFGKSQWALRIKPVPPPSSGKGAALSGAAIGAAEPDPAASFGGAE